MNEVTMTNEIGTAFLSHRIDEKGADALKQDAKNYIETALQIPVKDGTHLTVVENNDTACHLTLPYYADLENADRVIALDDEALEDPSGGILFLPFLVWGADFAANPDKYNDDATLKK